MIEEKIRLKAEYLKIKKELDDFEKKEKSEKHEQSESLNVFIKSVRNTSNLIVISDFLTSKKLSISSILIDEKDLNIED